VRRGDAWRTHGHGTIFSAAIRSGAYPERLVQRSPDGIHESLGAALEERVEALAAWVDEVDARLRAAELLTGDEKTAKELRRAIEAAAKHDPKLESRLTNRVDVLTDRLATLASTVSITSAALARKDGDVAALRREVDQSGAQLDAVRSELGRRASTGDVEKLRATLATLSTQRPEPSNDRLDRFGGKVEWLSERVDTLATTVATTAAGLAGREGELAALRQRLDEDAAQIAKALDGLREQPRDEDLGRRLELLEHGVATTANGLAGKDADIAALRQRIDEAYEKIGAVIADIQRAVVGVSAQVAALEELPQVSAQAAAHNDELEASIESMAEALRATTTRLETVEQGESSRGHMLEDLMARVRELKAARDSDREHVRESLEHLAAEIGERLDATVRDREVVEVDLSRVLDTWASDRSSLEARFEDVERRLARTAELDDLARRLDAVEHGAHGVFAPADGLPAGDGRFRLELRALELRLEQAEATAREGRDAVLAQLERIVARIEPHPRRRELHDESPPHDDSTPAGAEIVPFRGAEV
jgi:chromosome segregation ATPase